MTSTHERAEGAGRAALIAAGTVIVGLTGAAFWLSYAHLAGVAHDHGLEVSDARTWAWPATLDLFIIAGELLMFVSSLKGRHDKGAIFVTVAGSVGSIGLNVAGVGDKAQFLDYLVAAVPPTAALLAFGVLMRQVHNVLVPDTGAGVVPEMSPETLPVVPAVEDVPVSPASVDVPAVSREIVPPVSREALPVVPAVSREIVPAVEDVPAASPRVPVAVPAVSPKRPGVRVILDKTSEEIKAMSRSASADGDTPDVPEDKLKSLAGTVRWLREKDHSEDEIKALIGRLPSFQDVKPDTLKKAIQRTRVPA